MPDEPKAFHVKPLLVCCLIVLSGIYFLPVVVLDRRRANPQTREQILKSLKEIDAVLAQHAPEKQMPERLVLPWDIYQSSSKGVETPFPPITFEIDAEGKSIDPISLNLQNQKVIPPRIMSIYATRPRDPRDETYHTPLNILSDPVIPKPDYEWNPDKL